MTISMNSILFCFADTFCHVVDEAVNQHPLLFNSNHGQMLLPFYRAAVFVLDTIIES